MSTIVLATDGSPAAADALAHAIDAAREADAILHVIVFRPPAFFGPGGPVFATRLHEVLDARAVAEAATEAALAAGVRACAHELEGGDAAAIVEAAERLGAGAIVIGGHAVEDDRDPWPNVSRHVLEASTVPVHVVRPRPTAAT